MSDDYDILQVVDAVDKKNHEHFFQDNRVSITIVRTGTVEATTGSTIFIIKGEKVKKSCSDDFLVRKGCTLGSQSLKRKIHAWPIKCGRRMPHALSRGASIFHVRRKSRSGWLLKILIDSNLIGIPSLLINIVQIIKCTYLKEESKTSHANKGCDHLVSKNDKNVSAETLHAQRRRAKFRT